MSNRERVMSAHRYFIWAHRQLMQLAKSGTSNPYVNFGEVRGEKELRQFLLNLGPWLASLYVVVEAWNELGLEDETVDKHLSNSDNVNDLRRFRNAVFHYQPTYYNDKLLDFLTQEGSLDWAKSLHEAFSQFFQGYFGVKLVIDEEES